MGDATGRTERRRSSNNISVFTRILFVTSEHRYLATGVCSGLLMLALWGGWQQVTSKPAARDEDGFAEFDGFEDTAAPTLGEAAGSEALAVPAALSTIEPPAMDLSTAFPPSAVPAESAPAWLVGTIETDADPFSSVPESAIRYTRNVPNDGGTVTR
jgi:hypothetical protein